MRRFLPLVLLLLTACGQPPSPGAERSATPPATILVINPVTPAPATTAPATAGGAQATGIPPAPPRAAALPDLTILRQGWLRHRQEVTLAMVVENTSRHVSYEQVGYTATLAAADGAVVGTMTGTLTLLLPGMRLGLVDHGVVPAEIATMDLALTSGRAVPSEPPAQPIFATRQILYADQPIPQVTGELMNNLVRDVRAIQVDAIAYDANERIIGAGSRTLDYIPARGEIPVAVPIRSTGLPARVELWASLTPASLAAADP